MVDGIRFPQRLVTIVGEDSSTIEFDLIEVNNTYDEDAFRCADADALVGVLIRPNCPGSPGLSHRFHAYS